MASKTEQNIYKFLNQFNLPFKFGEAFLPITYTDKNGEILRAKSDAQLPIFGAVIHLEIKCDQLNPKTTKKAAEAAMGRVDPAKYAANPTYYQIINQWNHSACKVGLTQKAMTPSNLILIFDKPPRKTKNCDTPKLIEKYDIEYCIKENARSTIASAIFTNMPPTPRRADGWPTFHNLDTLVPLKSGETTSCNFSTLFAKRIALQLQEIQAHSKI